MKRYGMTAPTQPPHRRAVMALWVAHMHERDAGRAMARAARYASAGDPEAARRCTRDAADALALQHVAEDLAWRLADIPPHDHVARTQFRIEAEKEWIK